MNGTYSMKVNSINKTVDMTVSGSLTPKEVMEFVKEYEMKIGAIKASEYILKFDCRGLDVVKPDMTANLENCLRMYKESGFQKVEVGIDKNATIKLQLNRLARNAGLTNFEVKEVQ